jgi:hypothetical protein
MVRPGRRQSVSRSKESNYRMVAENFYAGAEAAKAYEYWNAAGVLIVHAAIAYTDAITIKVGGVKSRGEGHMETADLLKDTVELDESGLQALQHLRRMIEQKNLVSYSGEVYSEKDIDVLWKHLERYRYWARRMLSQ